LLFAEQIGLFNQISLEHCPGLATLLMDGEKLDELLKLSPEQILMRWVNYHLDRAGTNRFVWRFLCSVQDNLFFLVYTLLLNNNYHNSSFHGII
jgi:plastin-3